MPKRLKANDQDVFFEIFRTFSKENPMKKFAKMSLIAAIAVCSFDSASSLAIPDYMKNSETLDGNIATTMQYTDTGQKKFDFCRIGCFMTNNADFKIDLDLAKRDILKITVAQLSAKKIFLTYEDVIEAPDIYTSVSINGNAPTPPLVAMKINFETVIIQGNIPEAPDIDNAVVTANTHYLYAA